MAADDFSVVKKIKKNGGVDIRGYPRGCDLLSTVGYGAPKGRCGAIEANRVPLRQKLAPKGKWGAKKAYGAP